MPKKRVALALILLMVFVSACSGTKNEATPSSTEKKSPSSDSPITAKGDPYGKYDQSVSLKIAKAYNTKDLNLPNGDTVENNEYIRYVEKKLNVKVTEAWQVETSDAYNQKIGVSIAGRDLPDAFIVNEQQLKQLVAADLIEDLTDAYKNNANDYIRGLYDSYDNRVLGRATFNGKLMALPSTQIGQQFNIVWIRQDWLDTLGLKPPQTLDDLVNIAKTFIDKDASGKGTVGMTGIPQLAGWNAVHGFDPILGALNAYKSQWIKDASGNIVYSSTLPEMKTALGKLHDLYAQGIIDKEFAVRKDPNELVANNKVGIVFGPWWIPYSPLPDSLKNDPKAEWKPFLAPLDENGKFNVPDQDPTGSFLVVRKGYEHPEAVVRVLNVEYDGIRQFDPEAKDIYKDVPGIAGNWALWPFTLQVGPEDTVYQTHLELKKAIDAKEPSSLNAELKLYYDDYMKNQENPKKDLNAWSNAMSRMDGSALMGSDKINVKRNVFFGKTKTMGTKWAVLQKLESETFLKIIMGDAPLDSFDSFVTQWNNLGGKQIIEEIGQELNK
ncbi:extracellular solute-binding protein [Paenibacillus sp. KQZ6P-2]|uniref:Extracellular solute-binding protein n=1 Tax=Paenibacillus mangrovi TaxID=2931978 RepID=A0A9X1WQU1_9BACL|nr:extracellular solute-binding protein [Paenibacillus mangrovi]MCJ8013632.1 extracellular solute-binding protein [Paenibacillus mangrovi]